MDILATQLSPRPLASCGAARRPPHPTWAGWGQGTMPTMGPTQHTPPLSSLGSAGSPFPATTGAHVGGRSEGQNGVTLISFRDPSPPALRRGSKTQVLRHLPILTTLKPCHYRVSTDSAVFLRELGGEGTHTNTCTHTCSHASLHPASHTRVQSQQRSYLHT